MLKQAPEKIRKKLCKRFVTAREKSEGGPSKADASPPRLETAASRAAAQNRPFASCDLLGLV
jgi:hypothetical protein